MSEQAAVSEGPEKKAEAVRVLQEILQRMGLSGSFDVKDAADGGISIAMTLNGELPGAAPGKRSHVVDSLQFLLNKIVNRSPQSRRWVSLGLGEHPAPRPPKGQKPQQQQAQQAQPAAAPTQAPAQPKPQPQPQQAKQPAPQQQQPKKEPKPQRESQVDERALKPAADKALSAAATELAEKSAKVGRLMGIIGMSADDRARVVAAVSEVKGVKAKTEGEGRNRRVALLPDKPTPMPKAQFPLYDDDEEEDAED